MSWVLVGQIALLVFLTALTIDVVWASIIDKRREDAIKRKDAGL